MRPVSYLLCLVLCIVAVNVTLGLSLMHMREAQNERYRLAQQTVRVLGLSDLALSTEARYTRHLAVSDVVVPVMDHPGAIEHFPSGSFFRPIQ
ncbi:hypothetical protein [Desulfosediminicola flagellatus]|uniref:hypothetical protein n=1 Tax=Desulfosediminicola flagellatus TaxID=2569541 RepID=UPI0010AC8491|nr:hypothetical protein [Desulfosediminicola flagellatus]